MAAEHHDVNLEKSHESDGMDVTTDGADNERGGESNLGEISPMQRGAHQEQNEEECSSVERSSSSSSSNHAEEPRSYEMEEEDQSSSVRDDRPAQNDDDDEVAHHLARLAALSSRFQQSRRRRDHYPIHCQQQRRQRLQTMHHLWSQGTSNHEIPSTVLLVPRGQDDEDSAITGLEGSSMDSGSLPNNSATTPPTDERLDDDGHQEDDVPSNANSQPPQVDLEAPSPPFPEQQLEQEDERSADKLDPSSTSSPLPSSPNAPQSTNNNNTSTSTIQHHFTHMAADDSKYTRYPCLVDSTQHDRSVEIHLSSFARPHMRTFHMAWMSFFTAFFTWFALTPLLGEVAHSLDLTHQQIWISSVFAVAGSAVTRILIGPLCDAYGARWAMTSTLVLSAIPTALTGLARTAPGLCVLRLLIGLAGSSFVTCQYWVSSMFTYEVGGTANALAAGWGNLGGGVTQLVMGSLLFPLFKIFYGGSGWSRTATTTTTTTTTSDLSKDYVVDDTEEARAADLAWRTVLVFPALVCIVMAYFVIRASDDSPKGNYLKRTRQGFMPSVSVRKSLRLGLDNPNTWILFVQYGGCFGVEITMINAAALYFKEEFGQSTESAAAIASIFGWMNLFARGLGGFLSDIANAKYGMRGRLWIQLCSLVMEGLMVIVFSKTKTLATAIVSMVFFSIMVQAAEGSTFGIVPYVNPHVTGSVSGIVGAGGNVGGVVFALIFSAYDYRSAFSIMGWSVMALALMAVLISLRGHRSLFCGTDAPEVLERRSNRIEQVGSLQDDPDGGGSSRSHHHPGSDSDKSHDASSRKTCIRAGTCTTAAATNIWLE